MKHRFVIARPCIFIKGRIVGSWRRLRSIIKLNRFVRRIGQRGYLNPNQQCAGGLIIAFYLVITFAAGCQVIKGEIVVGPVRIINFIGTNA